MKPVNKTVCSLAALAPLAMAQSANAGQRPNIIFFLVDDFGWTEASLPFGGHERRAHGHHVVLLLI